MQAVCYHVTCLNTPNKPILYFSLTPGLDKGPSCGWGAGEEQAYLAEQPGVVLQQAGPVCVRGDPGILKPVLDG